MTEKVRVEDYFNNDQLRIDVFKSKYLKDENQTVDECFLNLVTEIANVSIEKEEERQKWIDIWYDDLMQGYWRPGGSIISGVNNKSKKISICNCTALVIRDDTLEDIYKTRYEAAKMAAYRQGLGIEFSKLRPKGAKVNNSSEESEGVINWMKSFDQIANEVGQKGRRPALLGSLKINHPDVIDFIKVKSDLKTLNNMNISVHITDDFIDAVRNDKDWKLSFETEHELIEKNIKARELFNLLCKQSYDFAEPGLQFIDRMKDGSIQECLGYELEATNAPVTGDSLISTENGLFSIKYLYNLKKSINVLVDSKHIENINRFNYGDVKYSEATFKKYENQQIYKIKFSNNQTLKCNDKHKWLTENGYKETKDICINEKILLPSDGIWTDNLSIEEKDSEDYIDGLLIGWFVGEKLYCKTNKIKDIKNEKNSINVFRFKTDNDIFKLIKNKYFELSKSEPLISVKIIDNLLKIIASNDVLYNWLNSFGISDNVFIIPEKCFTNRLFAAGFIASLLGSDGYISKNTGKIIFTTISKNIVKDLQILLSAFGIYSSYKKHKYVYTLYITLLKSKDRLLNRISVYNNKKLKYLKYYLNNTSNKCKNDLSVSVVSVNKTDKFEDMYCAVVPKYNGIVVNGILSSNCSEKPLPDKGVCVLSSINMEMFPYIDDNNFHSFMEDKIYSLVRFMDNVVQYEIDNSYKSPLEEQLKVIKDLREIGLGVTNLHKWFYDNNIEYDSDEAIKAIEYFFKYYQYYAFKASCRLAIERTPCDAWKKVNLENSFKETNFLVNLFSEFPDLKEMYYSSGLRNAAILSTAPAGSISMTFPNDCLSSGIEPLIGYAYWRRTRAVSKNDYDYYFVLPSVVKSIVLDAMLKNEYNILNKDDYDFIKNFNGSVLDQDGKIGDKIIDIINKYINVDLLKPAHKINPFKKVDLMSKVQKWVDAAISVTYNLPEDYDVEKIKDIYLYAHEQKLKSLSIYREGSREGILIFENPEKHKSKYSKIIDINVNDKPENIIYHLAPKRPKILNCDVHHCSVNGEKWIVLIGLYENKPFEIFAGKKNEYFNISSNVKSGEIFKEGSIYSLKIPYRNSYIVYNEIPELFMNDEYKALTRMISLALRHGVYYDYIIKQLKKSSDFVGDFMAVVSRVLSKYYNNNIIIDKKYICPNCDNELISESGCLKCVSCGYAKCE